ncbi:MAG: acyl-CoA dehydrogenase family protein, partial [Deltaproteobacteria bacterium]|nr:acyl-CoA dehydrogenase family protein [Deltaproteobacteria bacterium]
MDFGHSDKIQTIVAMIKEFVAAELIPLEPEFLVKDFSKMLPVIREKQEMVKKMELWAPNFPVECGGMGLSLLEHGLVSEALGYSPLGHYVFWCQAPDAGNVEILHEYGTKEQKQRCLNPLVRGEIRSCFAMT